MATFKKTLSDGTVIEFPILTYDELKTTTDHATRLITNKQRTPFQLQRGGQSKGFDIRDVAPTSPGDPVIIKIDENKNYVAMPKANYQTKLERELQSAIADAGTRRGTPFPSSVFNEIQSELSTRIAQLPATVIFLAEDTPFSGSYVIRDNGSISYSGIANSQGYIDRTFFNNSSTGTGASWSFANIGDNAPTSSHFITSYNLTYGLSGITGSHTADPSTTILNGMNPNSADHLYIQPGDTVRVEHTDGTHADYTVESTSTNITGSTNAGISFKPYANGAHAVSPYLAGNAVSKLFKQAPTESFATFVNGVTGNQFHQSQYTGSFVIRTWASASYSGSHINSSQFSNPLHSQSRVDAGKFYNYEYYLPNVNKTGSYKNISTAGYYSTVLKANIFGDGDERKFSSEFAQPTSALYAQDRELLTFPYDTVVASGSFLWSFSFPTLIIGGVSGYWGSARRYPGAPAYRPIKKVTLYWASGSGGLIQQTGSLNPGSTGSLGPGQHLSGSISPTHIIPDANETARGIMSGSHIFYNKELTSPASGGYYITALSNRPSNSLWEQPPPGPGISVYPESDRQFYGLLPRGAVCFIAGEGINDFGDPGENFAQNPFIDAHDSTNTKVIPAATRWNGQSFTLLRETGDINPGDYNDV